MEKQTNLSDWIKNHKKGLVYAGACIGITILVAYGIKNKKTNDVIKTAFRKPTKQPGTQLPNSIDVDAARCSLEPIRGAKVSSGSNLKPQPFTVSRHVRNLPTGKHASPAKKSEALKLNIALGDGQTWVDNYMKGINAA